MSAPNRLVIQVVPRLKPGLCGISDHAIALARELETGFGVSSAFVVLNSSERCDVPYPRIYCAPSELLESCKRLSQGQASAILLHYSGYGFSADGAPRLLPAAIESVSESAQFGVGVYFHEMFARAMPWRSAFWHTHRQRRVVLDIAKSCNFIATNLRQHSDWLIKNAKRVSALRIAPMPVFSNAGESVELTPMSARRPALVVFGLPDTRRRSYDRLSPLCGMLSLLGIEEIVDIGPDFDAPTNLCRIPVRRMGALAVENLTQIFSETMFGFVPHPPFCLAKSGIFAGFCANGTIPVLAESFSSEVDGLRDGVHLVSPKTVKDVLAAGLERCSAASWNWYSGHRLHVHAATYSQLLIQPLGEAHVEEFTLSTINKG